MWRTLALAALLIATPASAKKPKKKDEPVATTGQKIVPEETVALPCGYEPGAEHSYVIEKRSDRRLPGEEPSARGNRATVTLTVVSHEGDKTQLDVRYGAHEMLTPPDDAATEALLLKIAEVSSKVPVRVEVDHATSTHRVVDSTALMAAYASLADEVKAMVLEKEPGASEAVLAGIDQALANQQIAEMSIVEDLQPLFGFTCGKVPVGEVNYQSALPNPLGSGPLPALGTMGGTVSDEAVVFTVRERLDPERVMDFLRPFMLQMGVDLADDAALDDLQLELGTEFEVVVERASGWPTGWKSTRLGSINGGGRTDTVVGTRVDLAPKE